MLASVSGLVFPLRRPQEPGLRCAWSEKWNAYESVDLQSVGNTQGPLLSVDPACANLLVQRPVRGLDVHVEPEIVQPAGPGDYWTRDRPRMLVDTNTCLYI